MNRPQLLELLGELRIQNMFLLRAGWLLVCDAEFHKLFSDWGIPAPRLLSVDDLAEALRAKSVSCKMAVVCVTDAEAPHRRLLRENRIQTLGLFSEVIPRLAARAQPQFLDKDPAPPTRSYATVSLPGSGDGYLGQVLGAIGAGRPIKHFRECIVPLLEYRSLSTFQPKEWWRTLTLATSANGIFATKVHWDVYRQATRCMRDDEHAWMDMQLREMPILHLERKDKVAQAVSHYIARETGAGNAWDKDKFAYHEKLMHFTEDVDAVLAIHDGFIEDEKDLLHWLSSHRGPMLRVDLDDLSQNAKSVARSAAATLDFPLPANFDNRPSTVEIEISPLHLSLAEKVRAKLAEARETAAVS